MLPEEDRAKTTGDLPKRLRNDRSSGSRDMLADRRTHIQTDTQTDRNTPLPHRGGVKMYCRYHNVSSLTTNSLLLERIIALYEYQRALS